MSKPTLRQTRPSGSGLDPKMQAIYENLEILNGARGKGMDRAVLMRDLYDLDLAVAKKTSNGTYVPTKPGTGSGVGAGVVVDAPEVPKGVKVSGGFSIILVEWDKPTYSGHSYTEVLRSDTDDFSQAVLVSTTTANLYSDQIGGARVAFYWVRFVNLLDVKGPVQSTNGVRGETQADIGEILDILRGQIDESFLTPDFISSVLVIKDIGLLNKEKITTIDGKILSIAENETNLSAQADLLAEAAMASALVSDNESTKRRIITAEITLTQKALITEAGALASQILVVAANVDGNGARIEEVKTSVITLDQETKQITEAITQTINEQSSAIDTANANISTATQTLVAVGDKASANESGLLSLTSRVNIQESSIALANESLETANAAITTNAQTIARVDSDTKTNLQTINSVSSQLDQLASTVGSYGSTITTQQQTLVTITNAANAAQGTANAAVSAANAAQGTANTNAQSITVMSQRLTTVESLAGDAKAQVTQNTQTIATINADGTAAYNALWGVKASIGDIQAGIGLTVKNVNGVPTSQCTIIANQFSVGSKTGSQPAIYPFIVTSSGVFIDTAYIKAAKIQDLVAGEVVADNVKVGATLTAPIIKGGTLEIGSIFSVNANGNMTANYATMNNATVHGTINATGGIFNNVTIEENCDVKGTVYANKIVGDVYKAALANIAEVDFFSQAKNVYFTIASFAVTAQNLSRIIETPKVAASAGVYDLFIRVLFNGSIISTKQITFTTSPDIFISLPAGNSGTVTIQMMYSGNPSNGLPVLPTLPAQQAKYAFFKA